jgi:hypothetical protein
MADVTVKYNGVSITPTPLVSRGYQFIDLGNRFGQIEQIDLNCTITGISTYQEALTRVNNMFSGQFKTLEVFGEDSSSVYKWDNAVLQELSVAQSSFPVGGFVPYNARFLSYQIPSGVIDPTNEYAFAQNSDGTVTVSHRISARGIRTSANPLDNAIAFVNTFVRKNPFNNCIPAFIPNASGVLTSISESIDRTTATYSVNENYRYSTGIGNVGYVRTTNLTIDDSNSNDYTNLELSVKLEGSPVDRNVDAVQTALLAMSLESILAEYGIATSNIHRDTVTVIKNSGEASVELRANFISGSSADISGYFDYTVGLDRDEVSNVSNWRIDGEYLTRGPLSHRRSLISAFKTANQGNGYITYLTNALTAHSTYSTFNNGYPLNLTNVTVAENTGQATLRLSASFSDADYHTNLLQPKYAIEVEPSRWIYEMTPSANIEGHYVIQDLQMRNQAKVKISMQANTSGTTSATLASISGVMNTLSGIYVNPSSFLISESISTGLNNAAIDKDYLGTEKLASGFLTGKIVGSVGNGYVRPKGYKFGY